MKDDRSLFQSIITYPSEFVELPLDLREALYKRFVDFFIPSVSILCLICCLITAYPNFYLNRFIIGVGGLGVMGFVYLIKDRVLYIHVLSTLLVFSSILVTFATLYNGGPRAPAFFVFGNILVVSACIYDTKYSYIAFLFVVFIGILSSHLINLEILPQRILPPNHLYLVIYCFLFFIAIGTVNLNTQLMTSALITTLDQKSLLTSVFASLNESVFIVDHQLKTIQSNQKADLFTEWIQQQGKTSLFQVSIQQDLKTTPLSTFIQNRHFRIKNELITIRIAQTTHFFELTCIPLRRRTSSVYLILIREVSDLIQRQTHLQQVEKMNALGQLASGMAHDFNNLLTGIEGAVDILEKNSVQSQKNALQIINNTIYTASNLTKGLLSYGRHDTEELRPIHVNVTLQKVLFLLEHTLNKKNKIQTDFENTPLRIHMNESLFQNSIVNLALNASQAMPKGGTILFRTRCIHLTSSQISKLSFSSPSIQPGKYALIEIKDEGEGIRSEIKPRIFEPFFSTKLNQSGTGLGLMTVMSLVQSNEGAIHVESEIGEGTSFSLYFPLIQSFQSTEIDASSLHQDHLKKKEKVNLSVRTLQSKNQDQEHRILLVEDDEVLRLLMEQKLTLLGFTVVQAINGKEALELIKTTDFDLIILDLIMPIMNGEETFLQLQKQNNPPPVILVSGGTIPAKLKQMSDLELVYTLRKPYRSDDLIHLIHHIFEKSNPSQVES